jgi:predicted lipoprotein with Yx(FWY)xxD motif
MTGSVPARGARRVWGRAVAGALSASALAVGAASVALVLAAPAGTAGATSSHAKPIKISTAKVPNVGVVLTTASGLTLYRFTHDATGTSTCTGVCAKIWPPLLASKGAHVSGPRGLKGLSLINVGNGRSQVAFHKVALYRFSSDKKKGQALGQDVAGQWFAVLKSGIPATTATGAPLTPSTAPAPTPTTSTTPIPTTPTTQTQHSTAPAQAPVTQAPPAAPPPPPPTPTPTPTTRPPAPPTTTTAPSSGGAGF